MKKFLTIIMIIAMVFAFAACGNATAPADDADVTGDTDVAAGDEAALPEGDLGEGARSFLQSDDPTNPVYLGEGDTSFNFNVIYEDGTGSYFVIRTDQTTVGAALQELGMIDGEDSQYGLYVKMVNDIYADYDIDGKYWSFYADGEYAMLSCDLTEIEDGHTYEFRIEEA